MVTTNTVRRHTLTALFRRVTAPIRNAYREERAARYSLADEIRDLRGPGDWIDPEEVLVVTDHPATGPDTFQDPDDDDADSDLDTIAEPTPVVPVDPYPAPDQGEPVAAARFVKRGTRYVPAPVDAPAGTVMYERYTTGKVVRYRAVSGVES